ncbi:MAG: hypothetical protein GYB64_15270 [Chloroflexi bacterium]|nr:hypothetical protein [Chloroflexota bacterium]
MSRAAVLLLCAALLTAACIPEPGAPPSPNPTAPPTVMPSAAAPSPAPTDEPALQWQPDVMVQRLGPLAGVWSPTADELVMADCSPEQGIYGELFFLRAPDFAPRQLVDSEPYCIDLKPRLLWSPDGQQLYYFGITRSDTFEDAQIWRIQRSSLFQIQLENTDAHNPAFIGWMDSRTLAYLSRRSGGERTPFILNALTLSQQGGGAFPAAEFAAPHPGFLPFTSGDPPQAAVIVRSPRFDEQPEADGVFVRRVPPADYGLPGAQTRHLIAGWLPNTTRLLLVVYEASGMVTDQILPFSVVASWDVDTNVVEVLIPDAVSAQVTPEGIAYMTLGPPDLTGQGEPVTRSARPLPGAVPYLNLLVGSRVVYSRPVAVDAAGQPRIALNGSTLAVLTPEGLELVDAAGDVTGAYPASPDHTPRFAPGGSRIAYWAPDENLTLLDVVSGETRALTVLGGQRIVDVSFSHEGTYLLVRLDGDPLPESAVLIP